LDGFVLDNEDPLRLLAVDDDRLYDALLSGRGWAVCPKAEWEYASTPIIIIERTSLLDKISPLKCWQPLLPLL